MKDILKSTWYLFTLCFVLCLLIAILTITCCVTFPTRGVTQLWGSEWGLILVPLALFVDCFIMVSYCTYMWKHRERLPDWLKP